MHQPDTTSRSRSTERASRRSRLRGAWRLVLTGAVVAGVLGIGFTAFQEDEAGRAAEIVSVVTGAAIEEPERPDPQEIPVAEVAEPTTPAAEPQLELEQAPPEPEEPSELDAPAAAPAGPEPMVVSVEEVPTGEAATLNAGGSTATVATMSGTGTITLGFTRTSSSAAPNLPTYVSTICDGVSVYSGAFNTTSQGPVVQDVPYTGANCVVKVRIAQPSDRWTGTSSAVVVTRDAPESQQGTPYSEKAGWTTTAVAGEDSFGIDVPEGFTGTVSVKLTACSSRGGTSDETRKFACGDLVQKDVGSEGSITVSDGQQVLAETAFDITAETHHDMVTVEIDEPAADDLTISVERTDGSAVLVHGPGTSVVGTH